MANSIVLAADPSPLAALLVGYRQPVCALLAPCQRVASAAISDRLGRSPGP